MSVLVLLLFLGPILQPSSLPTHTGVYKGTARNAAETLQLGNADAVNSVFQLTVIGDSLLLQAITRSGTQIHIGTWPMSRVTATPTELSTKGLPKGPLHLRRDLQWTLSGGIRVTATVTTRNPSQKSDDFFGGGAVNLTLMKVR
jgi:hypothetical protein